MNGLLSYQRSSESYYEPFAVSLGCSGEHCFTDRSRYKDKFFQPGHCSCPVVLDQLCKTTSCRRRIRLARNESLREADMKNAQEKSRWVALGIATPVLIRIGSPILARREFLSQGCWRALATSDSASVKRSVRDRTFGGLLLTPLDPVVYNHNHPPWIEEICWDGNEGGQQRPTKHTEGISTKTNRSQAENSGRPHSM